LPFQPPASFLSVTFFERFPEIEDRIRVRSNSFFGELILARAHPPARIPFTRLTLVGESHPLVLPTRSMRSIFPTRGLSRRSGDLLSSFLYHMAGLSDKPLRGLGVDGLALERSQTFRRSPRSGVNYRSDVDPLLFFCNVFGHQKGQTIPSK